MKSSAVHFPGADGSRLAARLDWPEATPRAYALFAHCFTCSKDTLASARISAVLAAAGIAVLRFDFTGLGSSEGEFANTNFSSNVADLVAAADWLRSFHGAPQLLVGHSLGGAAVLAAAGKIAECVAVATIGAPFDPAHISRLFVPAQAEMAAAGEAEVELAGRRFRIRRQFLDDIAAQPQREAIAGLRRALLIFHSPFDAVVDISNAADIFSAAKHPKSFVSLDRADHLLTRKEDAAYVATVLAAWASRYLPAQDIAASEPAVHGSVRVVEAGLGKFAQEVVIGRHRLIADEPLEAGGDDLGPSPYELLLAGLGACTAMTLRMYAAHKRLPLDKASVELVHRKIHAQDCADCETKEGRIDRIDRVIDIQGPLDTESRARLLEIADRCPVHRTLHSEVSIVTRAAT